MALSTVILVSEDHEGANMFSSFSSAELSSQNRGDK